METITKTKQQSALRLLAALFFLCLFAPMAAGQGNWKDYLNGVSQIANTDGGDGSSWDKAIKIASAEELAYFAQQVNSNQSITHKGGASIEPDKVKDCYFALSSDINLSDHYWTPIGSGMNPFKGHFDGCKHEVRGLVVSVEQESGQAFAGLFGYLNDGATIRNLGIRLGEGGVKATLANNDNPTIESIAYVGGLAGYLDKGSISNCYVEGDACVMATGPKNAYAGGLVGLVLNETTITHCYTTVNVGTGGLQKGSCNAGGIVGRFSSNGEISYTYATGTVDAENANYAGGICGYSSGRITNSLALNTKINGSNTGRIAGNGKGVTFAFNYASPWVQLSGKTFPDNQVANPNGANTSLENFETDLKKGDPSSGWANNWTFESGKLPKLNGMGGTPPDAAPYFLPKHTLRIVSPTGGTLKVTDGNGTDLFDDSKIAPGTLLTLSYTENPNYRFSEYLSGSSADNLRTLSGNTILMPDADLYLSVRFNYEDPTPPPPTVYYTVTLPFVEGAVTDPVAGDYEVESWSTFRFYLTLDADYDESQPVVTTSRGETLQPLSSDGAYLVKYVRTDVEIFIDGIEKNPPPVANEPIRAAAPEPEIWSENACLCIRLPEGLPSSPVRIFTPEGRLLDSFRSVPGLNRRQLPTNIYIVQVGATVRKVAVK
ncbi:GLUG motif-containing protein [Parabacteroides gordonii]|uniref:GLUG motif-containing protein n=1 Tax=Parabacteroides gordonii TaxID=574930 RepID=UPI000EC5061A|nr:GLUG motif-containing protein [Parabacteroides gordonii]RGP16507.1 hypothetical protein DXB27_10590 [Parabacteroides gordonii]